VQNYKNLF